MSATVLQGSLPSLSAVTYFDKYSKNKINTIYSFQGQNNGAAFWKCNLSKRNVSLQAVPIHVRKSVAITSGNPQVGWDEDCGKEKIVILAGWNCILCLECGCFQRGINKKCLWHLWQNCHAQNSGISLAPGLAQRSFRDIWEIL